ncbi:serine/threonine protein kinase [Geoalkalibacter halelectricus]|uniref:serine/threonine protein kinase n=1 Tax=Geoalkalibacter halelectricus TaxID=2847045 RepID=UPI003D1CE145
MSPGALTGGSRVDFRNQFDLQVFEEIYPQNGVTGRALYKVRDLNTNLFYALKTFDLGCNDRHEIEKEVLSLNKADLGHIAPKCRALSFNGNEARLLMDWVEGKTFAQEFPEPPEDVFDLRKRVAKLQELCFSVDRIHAKNIFHRDLKPENIIISPEGNPGLTVRLIDFGLSLQKRQKGQAEGSAFRAPEQDDRRDFNLRTQADIFALGKIGWWLFTGKNPQLYVDESTCADWENLERLDLCQECLFANKSLEKALKTAMAYEPKKRYRHARLLGMALKESKV